LISVYNNRVNGKSLKESLKKIPEINFNANHWYELVDISVTNVTEPPTTQHFSIEQIQYMIDNNVKPEIPDFPSHSQSVERAVKLVSEASQYVYGFENRHSCILTKLLSRKMRKPYISKGHYSHSYDDIF
jgi:desulfoferrodoxin (superoxide reductase-like protein)